VDNGPVGRIDLLNFFVITSASVVDLRLNIYRAKKVIWFSSKNS